MKLRRLISLILFAVLLLCFVPANNIVRGEEQTVKPESWIDYTDYYAPDYKAVYCSVSDSDGNLKITAGTAGKTGNTKSAPYVEIPLTDSGLKATKYEYIAIRVRCDTRSAGGAVTVRVGQGKSEVTETYTYADTDDWQTVVVNMSQALSALSSSDKTGKWNWSVTLKPFGKKAAANGAIAEVNSIAFFEKEDKAKAFTGYSEDLSAAYEAQKGQWLADEFVNPGSDYRMMKLLYSFQNNYKNLVESLKNDYGYGGITTNVTFNNKYLLEPREFQLLDNGFKYCLETGMSQLWIYDEYQWPSGTAYGYVTKDHPEYEPYGIGRIVIKGKDSSEYKLDNRYEYIKYAVVNVGGTDKAIPVNSDGKSVNVNESGSWTLKVYAVFNSWTGTKAENLSDWQKGKPYVNIMSEGAIQSFINYTHQSYKEQLTGSFSNVEAFFTDEPSLWCTDILHGGFFDSDIHTLPWEESLPEVFKEMHGYDLYDRIDALFSGDTDADKVVRVNYWQTVAKMVSENYFGQIEEWCKENGVASSGHPLIEEFLAHQVACYGDLMACLSKMGYPGCDVLRVGGDVVYSNTEYLGSFAAMKYASSAARNYSKEHVMVEYNPEAIVYDGFWSDYFGESLSGAALIRMYGADKFVMLNPAETYNTVQARKLNDYVGRMNVLLEGADMNSGIAVYYPISSAQALAKADVGFDGDIRQLSWDYNSLCISMLRGGYDFNFLDEAAIQSSQIRDGKMYCGTTSYSVIVLPYVESMSLDTVKKLGEFEKSGGTLIWVNSVPSFATKYSDTDALVSAVSKYKNSVVNFDGSEESSKAFLSVLDSTISYGFSISDAESGITWSPYTRDGKQLIMINNMVRADQACTVSFGSDGGFRVYDLYTGVISEYTGKTRLTLDGFRAVIIVSDSVSEPDVNGSQSSASGSKGGFVLPAVIGGAAVLAAAAAVVVIRLRKKKA